MLVIKSVLKSVYFRFLPDITLIRKNDVCVIRCDITDMVSFLSSSITLATILVVKL